MPTKKPKPTEPWKVRAFLTGPCVPYYGGNDYRELILEIRVEPTQNSFDRDRVEFYLRAHSSLSSSTGKWSEPYLSALECNGAGTSISLEDAQKVVKHLTAVRKYTEKLPVPPRNLRDLVMVLAKIYHFSQVDLFLSKNHKTQSEQHEGTGIHRLAYLAQETFDALQVKEEVTHA